MSDKQQNIYLEATGEFPFQFYVEKAVASNEDSEMIIEGVASTTNIDHDRERMSESALRAMESAINKEGVPLRVEHQKDGTAVIGKVFKAWVDDRNQLHMKARLDKAHPVSSILHHSIKSGVKMGLSVGGLVKHATKEFSEAVGGMIKTFYDVVLQEVSVTPRPSNYDAWLIAKSIAKDKQDAELYSENSMLKREFLLENSQLDYLQAFAKSVPDKAWRKVDSPEVNKNNNNNMAEDKKEEMDETTKSVSKEEFNALQKAVQALSGLVSKGFDSLVKAMDTTPKETTNPDKTKTDEAEQQKAKAMDADAEDQANPDKKKPETEETAKAEESETDETKKAKEDAKGDTYDIETVNRSIKSIETLTKKIEDMKDTKETEETEKAEDKETEEETEKAEDKEEEETTTKAHPLDIFVVKMTKAMEAMAERLEKSGQRVLGFEKSFIEDIRNNPEVQKEIATLLKVPGFKKSVSRSVPYMVTKDGRSIPLIITPEKVEKNEKNLNFKDLYKTQYSSTAEAEQE